MVDYRPRDLHIRVRLGLGLGLALTQSGEHFGKSGKHRTIKKKKGPTFRGHVQSGEHRT